MESHSDGMYKPGGKVELHCNRDSSFPSHIKLLRKIGTSGRPATSGRLPDTETTESEMWTQSYHAKHTYMYIM